MDSIDSLLASSTTPTNSNKLVMDDLFDSYLSHTIPHTSTSQLIGHLPALEGAEGEEESKEFDQQDFDTLPPLSPIYSPNSVADDLYQVSGSSLSSTTTPIDTLDQLDSEDEDDDSVGENNNQHHATPSITSQHQTTTQLSAKGSTRSTGQRTAAIKRKTTAQDSDSSYREDSDSSNGDKSSAKSKGSKDGDSEKGGGSNKQQRRRLQNRNAAATSRMKRKQYVTSLEEKVEGLLAQQRAMTESLNQLQSENQQLKQVLQRQAPQQLQALPSQQRQLSATDGELPAINLEQSAVQQQLYVHQNGFRSLADELHLHDKSSIAATQPVTRVFNFDASPSTMSVFDTINSQQSASNADQSLSLLPVCRTGLMRKVAQSTLIKRVEVAEFSQQWVGQPSTATTLPWSVAASDSALAAWMVQLLVQTMLSFNLLAMLPLLLSSSGTSAAAVPWSKPTPTYSSTLASSAVFWRTLIEQQTLWQEHISQQLSRSHPCRTKSIDSSDGTPTWAREWSDTLTPAEMPHAIQPRVIEITI